MPAIWESSARKLKRAAVHFETLHALQRTYIRDGSPFKLRVELVQEERRFSVVVDAIEPPPSEMSLVVGDFVQNLRAALDHLVCALVEANGHSPTSSNAFPIFKEAPEGSRKRMERWARQLKGVGDAADALIRQVQPWRQGGNAGLDPLAVLQALSNEDKHRVVLQTVNAVPNPNHAPPKLDFDCHDIAAIESFQLYAMKPLADGDVLLGTDIEITGPQPSINIKGELPIEVAFGEVMIPASQFLQMFDRVDVIVAHIANQLLGADLTHEPLESRVSIEPPPESAGSDATAWELAAFPEERER